MKHRFVCYKPGAVFLTNTCIIWSCVVLIFEVISIGTNMWYVENNNEIKYVHGGLWNVCMGEIDRTFCSYIIDTPVWLQVTQSFCLMSLITIFIQIIYVMIAMARKSLRISILFGMSCLTAFLFFIGLAVYTINGLSKTRDASNTYYVAWLTFGMQLISCILCFYTLQLSIKLNKKQNLETGIIP